MSEYEVTFEMTVLQSVTVEAASKKQAIEKVKNGEYDVGQCESETLHGRRRWAATALGGGA